MALLIDTEHMKAIPPGIGTPLKILHSEAIKRLDKCAEEAVASNGGFADLFAELRRGLVRKVKSMHIHLVESERISN